MAKKKTTDERVAEVFEAHPEPVDAAPNRPDFEAPVLAGWSGAVVDPRIEEGRAWLVDAETAREVYAAGNVISPDDLKGLLNRAIGLMHQFVG